MTHPVTLGLKKSFGFGDRLGLATPGHLAAANQSGFAPIFAQQSIREMARTGRTPEEVMRAAQCALDRAGYSRPWGADADHLKTPEDVKRTASAGFCFFTIDPSEYVRNEADHMPLARLEEAAGELEAEGVFPDPDWRRFYLESTFEVAENRALKFTAEALFRAAVKYGRSIAHSATMSRHIAEASPDRPFEIEVSVDETDSPTSTLEHLFFGMELKRRGVAVVSLAPRFIGDFEKGIDYRGDLAAFEESLREHVAVAKFCGPYKISIHSGSDKFSIYPAIGRICGELLHVKTAGTSYLEALRAIARVAPELFGEIIEFCRGRFDTDRQSYHISTSSGEIASLPPYRSVEEEPVYLDEIPGRQLLHVTFGSVLTQGEDRKGRRFKESILELLDRHSDLHLELLERHFLKHLSLLNHG
jgi:tagaturonate epimerase